MVRRFLLRVLSVENENMDSMISRAVSTILSFCPEDITVDILGMRVLYLCWYESDIWERDSGKIKRGENEGYVTGKAEGMYVRPSLNVS